MPMVKFDRRGESGNIFAIIGKATAALKQSGNAVDAIALLNEVTHAQSYDEALEIISQYVDLIEEVNV